MNSERKVLLAAFRGDLMCFAHVMLNALEMKEKNYIVEIMLEGESTKIPLLFQENEKADFNPLWKKVVEKKLITAVCKACSKKMGGYEAAVALNLPIVGDMNGHPPFSKWIEGGYEIITF